MNSSPITPEKAFKLSERLLLLWLGIFFAGTLFLAFAYNIDPIGYKNEGNINVIFLFVSLIIWIVIYSVVLHVIGRIFSIKYFTFRINPLYSPDVWKRSSLAGKILMLLVIPEVIFIVLLMATGKGTGSGLVFLLLGHISVIYAVNQKAIKEQYAQWYGKEEAERVYEFTQHSFDLSTYFKTIDAKYLLFIAILIIFEFVITIGVVEVVYPIKDAWFVYVVLFFLLIPQVIITLYLKDKGRLNLLDTVSLFFRILLFFYWLFILFVIVTIMSEGYTLAGILLFGFLIPAFIISALYIFGKSWVQSKVWKVYSIVFIVLSLVITPLVSDGIMNNNTLIFILFLAPIYIVLLREIFINQKKVISKPTSST